MSRKAMVKMCIDLAMTAALPMLMCYSIVDEMAHEVIGVVMFYIFIVHHILNFGWIKMLFKGKYNLQRSVNTAVNGLVFLCMIGLMYSSIVISKCIFTFINIRGAMTARTVHMLCSYWGLVLMSIHFGMHIRQVAAIMKIRNKTFILVMRIVFGIIASVGIYEFISLRFATYMFGIVQFVFIDTTASVVLTSLKYLSVMGLFAYMGYGVSVLLSRKTK